MLPISITGSIALERALLGKSTVLTGHPWFKGIPGTVPLYSIRNADDLMAICGQTSDAVAEAAYRFVDGKLSIKTLTNAPGIGSGLVRNDRPSVAAFETEFARVLDYLRVSVIDHA